MPVPGSFDEDQYNIMMDLFEKGDHKGLKQAYRDFTEGTVKVFMNSTGVLFIEKGYRIEIKANPISGPRGKFKRVHLKNHSLKYYDKQINKTKEKKEKLNITYIICYMMCS